MAPRAPKKATAPGPASRAKPKQDEAPSSALAKLTPLFAWAVERLGFESWAEVKEALNHPSDDAETKPWIGGETPYLAAMRVRFAKQGPLEQAIVAADARIVVLTAKMNASKGREANPIRWKYFQYFALLATELYLDQLYAPGGREALRKQLNAQLKAWRAAKPELRSGADTWAYRDAETNADRVAKAAFATDDLDKLAFWQATGSGKTLILHANIYQHRAALCRHGLPPLRHTILLVPTAALRDQHLGELKASGLVGRRFGSPEHEPRDVTVIEVTSLREKGTENTVAVAAFESNNLLLVDEGHRGTTSELGTWRTMRALLAREGFTFEYSATFAQAAEGSPELLEEYGKSIIIDYAFRRFHREGYGKHFRVLNLATSQRTMLDDPNAAAGGGKGKKKSPLVPVGTPTAEAQAAAENLRRYLIGALTVFYQQRRGFRSHASLATVYNIERPLCVFVGASVVGSTDKADAAEDTDLIRVLRVLAGLCAPGQRAANLRVLSELLSGKLGFNAKVDGDVAVVRDLFDRSAVLGGIPAELTAEDLYRDMLREVFNASGAGSLHLSELRGAPGEIALYVGNNSAQPFGVINVGDSAGLRAKVESTLGDLVVIDPPDSMGRESLFSTIDTRDSGITMLLGSRKFSEGWSSWRVSMMGLLNLGKGQGAQIIQLFGRGVRLLGKGGSLKRSSIDGRQGTMFEGPDGLALMHAETFNVFGLNADYMDQFQTQILKEGGDDEGSADEAPEEWLSAKVPIRPAVAERLPSLMLVVPPATPYASSGKRCALELDLKLFRGRPVVFDAYPRVSAIASAASEGSVLREAPTPYDAGGGLSWLDFIDHRELFESLRALRDIHRWWNLDLPRYVDEPRTGRRLHLTELLLKAGQWYALLAPAAFLDLEGVGPRPLARIPMWTQVAKELLAQYAQRFYQAKRRDYETTHMRLVNLRDLSEAERQQLVPDHHLVYASQDDAGHAKALIDWLTKLGKQLMSGSAHPPLRADTPAKHLYAPLLVEDAEVAGVKVSAKPVLLDSHEAAFVADVSSFAAELPADLAGIELHVLRNEVNKSGPMRVGFATDGERYFPDFMLWIIKNGVQYLTFVDTKGLVHLGSHSGQNKLDLWRTVRKVEEELKAAGPPHLDAWLVSSTRLNDAPADLHTPELAHRRRVVFPGGQRPTSHIERIVRSSLAWAQLKDGPKGEKVTRYGEVPVPLVVEAHKAGPAALAALRAKVPQLSDAGVAAALAWADLHPE